MNEQREVRADFEGIYFECPKCGCELACGIDWDDEDGGAWECDECKEPYSIRVINLGYSVDVKFSDVTLEGSY